MLKLQTAAPFVLALWWLMLSLPDCAFAVQLFEDSARQVRKEALQHADALHQAKQQQLQTRLEVSSSFPSTHAMVICSLKLLQQPTTASYLTNCHLQTPIVSLMHTIADPAVCTLCCFCTPGWRRFMCRARLMQLPRRSEPIHQAAGVRVVGMLPVSKFA